MVAPNVVASIIDRWPAEALLLADVDSVGPGGRSAWIRAGTNEGVRVGDTWWLRIGGQPAARCDVRFVALDVCFCAVVPLASDPSVRAGVRVALWPAPGERRTWRATSAVSYIEERNNSTLVWVAGPVGVACSSEAHVDFFHAGQYVDHAVVERRDSRFWYARLLPTAARGAGSATSVDAAMPDASPTSSTAPQPPSSQPTRIALPLKPALRVGDDVVIRTQADVDQRRFIARVFDVTPAGALVNAGEADGLAPGQTLKLFRAGEVVGDALVQSVQSTYAIVGLNAEAAGQPITLRIGDELWPGPPPSAPMAVGLIQSVTDETLFTARVADSPPLRTPLLVRASKQTVGVAVLVAAENGSAVGFALPCAQLTPLAGGMQLLREAGAPQREPELPGVPE